MRSLYQVLKASKFDPVSAPDMFTALWAKNISGGGSAPTEHEYTGTVPTPITANGEPLISWTISGNMEQTGTPTPSSPIYPTETGNKTANLYYKSIVAGSIDATGKITGNSQFMCYVARVEANKTYVGTSGYVYAFYATEPNLGSISYDGQRIVENAWIPFTAPIDGYVAVRFAANTTNAMLNEGSTALPYEPWGYKIPILSGGTTTPVYLGEEQSERKIKKYEFTGEETFGTSGSGYTVNIRDAIGVAQTVITDAVCSHYQAQRYDRVYSGTAFGFAQRLGSAESNRGFSFSKGDYESTTDFKTYLQQQYSAGTPVTVWYVLATPTTTTLNEPLRKIDTYADSISNVTQIPTTAGSQTFDVDTTLKPSEVYIKYKG